jgi:hypothetical protein
MRKAIEIFVQYHHASIATGCPLERWLRVLDEADYSERKQTQFISTLAEADQRKAHDLIEARRLAWSVAALYAPGRREPEIDKTFVTDQLLGSDDPQEPEVTMRMPVGTFMVHFAARLQRAAAGHVHLCGSRSKGVDLVYQHANGGVALIEQKERAYYKSRGRNLRELVADVRSRAIAAAQGLQAVTNPAHDVDGTPVAPARVGARVVVVGTATTNHIGHGFYDGSPSIMAQAMTRWQVELSKRGFSFSPHAMLVFCMAHDIEPTTMVSAALGRFINFHLFGGGKCDDHWRLVAPAFQKMVPSLG